MNQQIQTKLPKIDHVLDMVHSELTRAMSLYEPMHSNHEGWAVIREELDELWDEVKRSKSLTANDAMQTEAVHVAAMAVRFIVDLCHSGKCDMPRFDVDVRGRQTVGLGQK